MASTLRVDKVDPQSGTALEIGTSGDTVTVPSGVGLTLTDSTLLLPTTIKTDKLDPKSGTALEIGTSGDTITVPTGAGLTVTDEVKTNKISPATGVAFALGDSGDTFTVPSGATIVNSGTATGFGGGKIGQVVSVAKTDTFTSTSGTLTDITGMSAAITPSATSSKVLVLVNMYVGVTADDRFAVFQLIRGSTAICLGDTSSSRTSGSAAHVRVTATGSANELTTQTINFLDSPSSTSEETYKMQGLVQTDGSPSFTVNRSGADADDVHGFRLASTITLMEVLA